jgi:two-component system, chemotaxis family, protein-glutamate methylesterase/glutaminase
MSLQDIIVIGASAGGVQALTTLVAELPSNLPAAVFVVLHIGKGQSTLPQILTRAGSLPALHPSNCERIMKGKIYIAPPDCHMLIEPDQIRLSDGPRENRTRPAINPLFRSAALAYGARVIGVILTGTLDDGTTGLAEIKRQGGISIVQDPETADAPSMPSTAIIHVDIDYIVPLIKIPALLVRLSSAAQN